MEADFIAMPFKARASQIVTGAIPAIFGMVAIWVGGTPAFGQNFPPQPVNAQIQPAGTGITPRLPVPSNQPHPAPPTPAPDPLQWDSRQKELTVEAGATKANFVFTVTNTSDFEAIIERVQPSCLCTVAKIPSTPWHLAGHSSGEMEISVNIAGHSGSMFKTITVVSTNTPVTLLVRVNIPEAAEMARGRNQMIALADRQAVFKGQCAQCHFDPAKGKMAKELYLNACKICHEANPRATMVPSLHMLNHPTDYAYWKQWITNGKPGSLMPAFAVDQGGPLTDAQIDSLAKTLVTVFPSHTATMPANTNMVQPVNGTMPVIPPFKNN